MGEGGGFSRNRKIRSLSEIDMGRDKSHMRQITVCQR